MTCSRAPGSKEAQLSRSGRCLSPLLIHGSRVGPDHDEWPIGRPKISRFIGTMNAADRSIRIIDTALRRRFEVFECPRARKFVFALDYDLARGTC
jgi:5-methylcytosine-specific restriction endonuclease McrBC GTP-binding regulatory subunit McrB